MWDKTQAVHERSKTIVEKPLRCAIDINTSSVAPRQQFDLFRSWHSNIVDVELLRDDFNSFPARERAWQLDSLVLASIEYPGNGYYRRWRTKRIPVFDHWVLCLPQTVSPDGGFIKTGNLRWQCLATPHQDQGVDDGVLCLFLPRHFAFLQPAKLDIRPEMAAFITDYIMLLHGSLPDRAESDVPHIAAATTSLLAACIAPSQDHFFEAQGAIDAVIMARASKLIAGKLVDSNLTPEMLCKELGISRSRLYRIFEPAGGVSNYIRRQRLLKTRDALTDISDGRPISIIAERWGFMDPSTFSRTFRKEFGMTPKEAREKGWLAANDKYSLGIGGASMTSLNNLLANAINSRVPGEASPHSTATSRVQPRPGDR